MAVFLKAEPIRAHTVYIVRCTPPYTPLREGECEPYWEVNRQSFEEAKRYRDEVLQSGFAITARITMRLTQTTVTEFVLIGT